MSARSAAAGESIPAMTAAAADRFGDQLAVVDGDTQLTYAELLEQARTLRRRARGRRASSPATGWPSGRFNSAEWIVAVLGLFEAGAVLVPVNTRFKGVEAADILRRSRARVLVTVTDFLGHRLRGHARATPASTCPTSTRSSSPAGRRRRGPRRWDDFLGRADAEARGRGRPARRGGRARRPVRHPLHLGHDRRRPRASCRPTAARCAWPPTGWP